MDLILESYDTLFDPGLNLIRKLIRSRPVDPPRELISEYAAAKRILPPETPFPGPWDNYRTPYLVEIMDQMSPYSPAHHVRFMKCAQVGATAAAENIMAYWMDENPAPIMVTSATDGNSVPSR
jgi:phage terminase large subunit GpA-like protein